MVLGAGLRTASFRRGISQGRHSRAPSSASDPVNGARPPPIGHTIPPRSADVLSFLILSASNRRREVNYESQQMGLRAYLLVGPLPEAG